MPNNHDNNPKLSKVLVIDDEPTNRILLRHMLKPLGCQIKEAESVEQGLVIAEEFHPDLFLLDIMMPQTTGFEMCLTLKKMPNFAKIPVIFITALTDVQEKVRGFAVGGADYITKPFQKEEVAARVLLQLELQSQRIALQKHAENLEEMVQARTRQLLHADRLVTIGTMATKILHEINNPLSLVMGNLQIIQETWTNRSAFIRDAVAASEKSNYENTRKLLDDCLSDAFEGARRIAKLADGLRQYSRRNETKSIKIHALKPLIEEAVRLMTPRLKHRFNVHIDISDDISLACDADRLQQVFINLMANSADAAEKGNLVFSAHAEPDAIFLAYEDDGPGIPEELRDRIFESFYTTKGPDKGTGIGMTIIQEILREHGGGISLGQSQNRGTRFDIRLDPKGRQQSKLSSEKQESGDAK